MIFVRVEPDMVLSFRFARSDRLQSTLVSTECPYDTPRTADRTSFVGWLPNGLGDPLLVVLDGAAGIVKAIETCFPRSARQRA